MTQYGFNFQWMFMWEPGRSPESPDLRALDFLAEYGFNFVRIPTDYRFWTTDFAYFKPNEKVWDTLDAYLLACQERGLHLSLNLHRAPGYCINGNHLEKHNLWLDTEAQSAFVWLWEQFALRYKSVAATDMSFDLLNEPPDIGQYGMTRNIHADLMRRTVAAIRAIDPKRPIVIDGLEGGHTAMPELADLGVTHSGRGYQPQNVSHYLAKWWPEWEGQPFPVYPETRYHGQTWDRTALYDFYQPWRDVEMAGATIHMGEFGCYNQTPNDVALRWLADLLSVWQECGWGYALWEFAGPFGIVEHGRSGATYEPINDYNVDQEMLNLLLQYQVNR